MRGVNAYPGPVTAELADDRPGTGLGLPPEGPGSVAPLGRRILALIIDWFACQAVAVAVLGMPVGQVSGLDAFGPLGLFFLVNLVLVTTIGTTIGHRLLGVRVISLDGDGIQPPPPARSAVRALLLCFFVPAVVMDGDMRGLHDKAARTVVVRTR